MNIDVSSLVNGARLTEASAFSSLVVLAYDHLLTLEAERLYVWTRRRSFGSILFLFNRYFGLFSVSFAAIGITLVALYSFIEAISCSGFFWWEGVATIISILTAEVILQARIYAVYSANKRVLIVLVVLFIAQTISLVSILLYLEVVTGNQTFPPTRLPNPAIPIPDLDGCFTVRHLPEFWLWIPPVVFEAILCSFMVHKAWTVYREEQRSPLLMLLIRDSVLYFLSIFIIMLVNCLVWIFNSKLPSDLTLVAASWLTTIPCVVGNRLLLNIREQYFEGPETTSAAHLTTGWRRDTQWDPRADSLGVEDTNELLDAETWMGRE